MRNLLHSIEMFYDDKIEIMIAMARLIDTSFTKNKEKAFVKNYPLSILQRATLHKEVIPQAPNKKVPLIAGLFQIEFIGF